ncbi:MAG: hypothetical protein KAJ07_01055 [Planctomycetes bacterium]|nr:hypothetical protein [Planctomycetota bacterium]
MRGANKLYDSVKQELCPDGNWKLRKPVKDILHGFLNRLPCRNVSEEEMRYPTNPSGMRAFLDIFFARHYFQIQDSLIGHMTSDDFVAHLYDGQFNILDIGSGPSVASLAITDMLACIIQHLSESSINVSSKKIRINYILNDTSGISLAVGKDILKKYFELSRKDRIGISNGMALTLEKKFPLNMDQLNRIQNNLGPYKIINLSYVVKPLFEQMKSTEVKGSLYEIENLCDPKGKVLIVQDKFSKSVIHKAASLVGRSCEKRKLTQCTYSSRNENEFYSYEYYICSYSSRSNELIDSVA